MADTRLVMCLYKWPWMLHSYKWSFYQPDQLLPASKPGLGLVLVLVSMWMQP